MSTTITARPGDPFLEVSREFAAAPAQVFRAWTEPELVVQWLGPRELTMEIIEYDVRPGGVYHYIHRTPDGAEHRFRGVFHTVAGGERLISTFEWAGAPDQVSLETVTFTATEKGTRVDSHAVFPTVAARDAAVESGMERGIRDSDTRLTELLGRL